jgi:hypothetical protein
MVKERLVICPPLAPARRNDFDVVFLTTTSPADGRLTRVLPGM